MTDGSHLPPDMSDGNAAHVSNDAAQSQTKFASSRSNLEVALRYADAGIYVHPCRPDKTPLTKWRQESTCDRETILRWWLQWPDALVGIDCGKSRLLVIDCDRKKGGPDGVLAFDNLFDQHGWLDGTPVTATPNNGYHYYFRQPDGGPLGNRTGALPEGVDVRGDGGFAIAAGSVLPDGREWKSASATPELADAYVEGPIPVAPQWLIDAIRSPKANPEAECHASSRDETEAVAPQSKASETEDRHHHRLRSYALAALDRNVAGLMACRKGGRNILLNNVSLRAGRMAASGWLKKEEAFAPFKQACIFNGYIADKGMKAFRDTFESGFSHGLTRPLPDPVDRDASVDAGAQAFADALNEDEGAGAHGDQSTAPPGWPDPKPIRDELPPVPAFDPAFLPDALAAWVADIAERMQCALDFVGVSVLIALGAIIGRKLAIRPQRFTDWFEVANLWGCIVGRPGMMKSPAMNEALKPLNRLESVAREENEEAMKEFLRAAELYKMKKEVHEKRVKAALAKGDDTSDLILDDEPEPPRLRRYVVTDCTYEALGSVLAQNPDGVLAFRDELVSLLKHLDDERNASARGFYLTAWNGTSGYTFDRIVRGMTHIDAACLSLLGSTQPGRLAEYMRRSQGAGDDGMIQRFSLLIWPDQGPVWKHVDRYPDSEARKMAWGAFDRLDQITPASVGAEVDDFGGLPFLRFEDTAQEVFDEWRKELEMRLRGGDLSPALESHLAKFRKLVPALALTSHLADGGHGPVSERAVLRALAIAEYAEAHARRCYSAGAMAEVAAAKAIISHIRKGDLKEGFSLRDAMRNDWSNLTNRDHVSAGLALLVDLHWLAAKTIRTGGRPSTVYSINPKAFS